jgi:hypothetical protein
MQAKCNALTAILPFPLLPASHMKAKIFNKIAPAIFSGVHGARFWTEICTQGCHWFPQLLA